MMHELSATAWIAISFVPIALLFVWALWRADQGESSTFKVIHFVTNDAGRGSNSALGYTMLVVVSAWGMCVLIAMDKLTEWYLTIVIGGFIIGSLGSKGISIAGRVKGMREPPPDAGDLDAAELPAIERHTRTEVTERVPANPLAGKKPIPVEVANPEPIEVTQTPKAKRGK